MHGKAIPTWLACVALAHRSSPLATRSSSQMATAVAAMLNASSIIHPSVRPWTPSGPVGTIVAAPQRQLRKGHVRLRRRFVRIASRSAVSSWPGGRDRGHAARGGREKRNQAPPAEGRTPLTYLVQTATLEWDPYGTSLHIWGIPPGTLVKGFTEEGLLSVLSAPHVGCFRLTVGCEPA